MSTYYYNCENIECEKAEVIAKKIVPSMLLKDNTLGRYIKYSCTRNGTAEIKKIFSKEPEEYVNPNSNRNIGDKIQSESFFVKVKGIRLFKKEKISGHTHTHSSQKFQTKNHTYAEITKPFPHIQHKIDGGQTKLN